ncbi:unnamed protein product [Phytophthora fragariaefolia]|uniref:Unnamed protein product n=1 Tax=Phytophthora fragariaefolia TaxID=1490495 RepID=A0A9W6U2H3_9STRA|nr:unnamed protein product [Phytophthora fragariaefolia]
MPIRKQSVQCNACSSSRACACSPASGAAPRLGPPPWGYPSESVEFDSTPTEPFVHTSRDRPIVLAKYSCNILQSDIQQPVQCTTVACHLQSFHGADAQAAAAERPGGPDPAREPAVRGARELGGLRCGRRARDRRTGGQAWPARGWMQWLTQTTAYRLVNDGKNPMQDRDLVLVLRDSSVKSRLPAVESSFFAGLLPMLQTSKQEEPRALEIIGGSDQHPHAQLPLIYPGACLACTKSPDGCLRELEQLRVLVMYEFDPPLSTQELVAALRACNNCTKDASEYLRASRRHQRAVSIPASAPPVMNGARTPEREKRRMSASSVDDNVTPSKRRKELSFGLLDSQEKDEEEEEEGGKDTTPDTQMDAEMLPTAADCARAQQLLQQTVEDRVAARQTLRNPDWVNEVWACLQVPAVLELAMHLNLTVDALATWVKTVDTQDAQDIQTRGAALTVEVAASLPPDAVNATDAVACVPKDEGLTKSDEEVATLAHAEAQAAELSAYERAKAAKSVIESLSSACKAYMNRLSWFNQTNEKKNNDDIEVERALEILDQKLSSLMDVSTRAVKDAEQALVEAKQMTETRTLQIIEFVRKRHEELVAEGESEASASLQSVVEVWKQDDVEVQALWKSRSDSKQRVKKSAQALQVANHALAFHKNLSILYRKVCERRKEALKNSRHLLEETCAASKARATAALENFIPMLVRALSRYSDFHSIRQARAKEELQEQEKSLAAHVEYFGDSAPIKKGDIERRIREFIGVTQSSMQVIMEIAEDQRQLWEEKHSVLPQSVRLVLIREFKALWQELSGPMRDVMKKFVATIEAAAGGIGAVNPSQQPAVVVFGPNSDMEEQVIPAFTVPAFPNSHIGAVTPYRTAISAIVAPNEVKNSSSSPRNDNEPSSEPSTQCEKMSDSAEWSNVSSAGSTETRVASSLQGPEPQKPDCEFAVGSIVYSKITVGENCTQFVRGVVLKQLDDDMYQVQYDNGDKFSVGRSFLFTQELVRQSISPRSHAVNSRLTVSCLLSQMEQNLKAGGAAAPLDHDTEMDAGHESSDGGCTIIPDHTANLLSPTLSSFDFDDDSSEDESDDSSGRAPGTPPTLVEATRHESEIVTEGEDGKPETVRRPTRTNDHNEPFNPSIALELRDRQSLMHHLNAVGIPGRVNRSSTTGSALEAFGGSSQRMMDGKNGVDSDHSQQQQHLMYRIMYAKQSSRDIWHARANPHKLHNVARSIMFSMHLKKEHIFERFFVIGMALSETERQRQPSGLAGYWKPKLLYDFPNILRMVIENELEQQQMPPAGSGNEFGPETNDDEHFEIILRPLMDLAMEFTIFHEENPRLRDQLSEAKLSDQKKLASIATKLDVSSIERRVVLSEDASIDVRKGEDTQVSTETRRRPSQLRKSLSTDDISNYNAASGWITDKPMVKSIGATRPKEYDRVIVGDILEAVDSIATARRIKINDPGHWSTARFPLYDFSYQFPKRHSDRWSVGVVLRFLAPDKVVEIMAYLLLEKQVVIMGESPAMVSAVCTALLLLLAPFQWQSTYIPLLPSGLLDFLHSPVPFLVGCHLLSETSEWSDVCFYDIDRDCITVTRHLGPTSIPNGVELCRLLRKAKERFCALRPTENPWYELSDEQDTIITLTMQEAEIFLRDLGFDISSQDLAASISGGQSFYDRLQEEVAKEVRNSMYEDYLDEFTQTQLFCQYYESLLQPEAQKTQKQ